MIRAPSALFWLSLAIITTSMGFYQTTNKVQLLEQKLRGLNASMENEQQSLHVLKAEWVYLANPERVEEESRKHLALGPTAPRQVVRLSDLASMLPTRDEAMANVAQNTTPVASIRTRLAAAIARPAPVKSVKGTTVLASADDTHINEHMIIQHTVAVPVLKTDSIGALIDELRTHP